MRKEEWDKISKDYYIEILSPFENSAKSPLFNDLRNMGSKRKFVIDVGCGLGGLEPFLAKNFRKALAIDFSKEMISKARKKYGKLKNVEFKIGDILDLVIKNKFDVAVAVNSILSPNVGRVNRTFEKIYYVLKKRGFLLRFCLQWKFMFIRLYY